MIFLGPMRWMAVAAAGAVLAGMPAMAEISRPDVSKVRLRPPLPQPYDAAGNARAAIDAALLRAKSSGKRVLIDLGANWCPDCRVLAGVMEIPAVHAFVGQYFETVSVDVDRFNKNMDVPARFNAPKLVGIPTILVVTPEGKLVNVDETGDLSNDRTMTPQAIVDWLALWVKAP